MHFKIEIEREDDGRWIAEVPELPGVMTHGKSRNEAMAYVQALALRVLTDRLDHAEAAPDPLNVTFKARDGLARYEGAAGAGGVA
jgi:predicted RNase H-like HicB family nuclease